MDETKKTISFSAALYEMLTLGARIRRQSWPPGDYLEIKDKNLNAFTACDSNSWTPTAVAVNDLLAQDWEIVGSDIGTTTFTPAQA